MRGYSLILSFSRKALPQVEALAFALGMFFKWKALFPAVVLCALTASVSPLVMCGLGIANSVRLDVFAVPGSFSAEDLPRVEGLSPDARALLKGMVLGAKFDRSLSFERARSYFSEIGVLHLFAVSGAHVSALSLLFGDGLLGLSAVWAYVAICGFAPSAVRAGFMASMAKAGRIAGYDVHPVDVCSRAHVVLLLANPAWLRSVGFWMSFFATLSILTVGAVLRRYVPGWLSVALSAPIGVFPIQVAVFGSWKVRILANVVLMALASAFIPVGVLFVFCAKVFPAVAGGFVPLLNFGANVIMSAVVAFEALYRAVSPVVVDGAFIALCLLFGGGKGAEV